MYVSLLTLISGLILCFSVNVYADAPMVNSVVNPTVNSVANAAPAAKASVIVKLSNIKVEKTVEMKGLSVSKTTQEFVFKGNKARYDVTFDVQTQ